MAEEFRETHRITYYETDTDGYATPAMLLNMVILVSEDQNDALGLSRNAIKPLNVAWIVVQYSINISRLPETNERVILSTKATSYNKLFAFREFWIRDSNDELCVYIKSTWIAMNVNTRKLAMIPKAMVDPYKSEKVRSLPHLPRPKRIDKADGKISTKQYRVRYTDIDFNKHVNNSKYLDWIMDSLSYEFLTNHQPEQIDIKFENEVLYGNNINSNVQILNDGNLTKHEIIENDNVSAVANIKWRL